MSEEKLLSRLEKLYAFDTELLEYVMLLSHITAIKDSVSGLPVCDFKSELIALCDKHIKELRAKSRRKSK